MSEKIKVGITQGDINGVGYEVIIKTLLDNRMCEICTPIVYGSSRIAQDYKQTIRGAENFSFQVISSARDAKGKKVCLINCINQEIRAQVGKSTKEAGKAAVDALVAGVKDLKDGLIDVLVTAPINKENVQSENFNFTGHTEFLADALSGEPLMIMCSDILRVGLVTIHTPVTKIAPEITVEKIVERIKQLNKTLKEDFAIVKPRIAVFALNPHAGDGGMLGTEERDIISPAITKAIKEHNILAFGPFPADGFFAAASYKKYDGILAMYHDQGLAPFKALSPDGVNFSATLPLIRTSPDHGVAYDIAGKDVADPSSMRAAIYSAIDIYRNRKTYKQITSRPLRKYEREKGADVSVKDLAQTQED